jgi:hypothetical protein
LAIKMNIFEEVCSESKAKNWECNLADLEDNENILDFNPEVRWFCEKWIDEKDWYVWRFVNKKTWEQVIKYKKFIDNYDFLIPWDYKIFLRVTDKCWNSGEVYNELLFTNDTNIDLKVSIEADPIIWPWPLEVDLRGLVNGWVWPYEYKWDFGDWKRGNWKIVKHTFVEAGVYKVTLTVIDKNWNIAKATVLIKVLDNVCSNDSDLDWVNDCDDMCSLVKWDKENNWCPIFIKEDMSYDVWECVNKQDNSWFIFWNVICSSCPCKSSIDFRSTLRECDVIIPAITSPLEKEMYSRWKVFQIKK